MGQTVLVDADTSFDDNIPGASLAGLAAGDIVEVSGMRRADGDIQATRIEGKPAGTVFEVTGVAAAVDTAAHKLKSARWSSTIRRRRSRTFQVVSPATAISSRPMAIP